MYASHPGGVYEDLERRVVEAVERGYNTLRVDCFPSRILEGESTFEKNWTPGVNLPMWGQTAMTFTAPVRQRVAELAELCRKHGLWLGLDSWEKPKMFGHTELISEADEEREFARFARIWVEALEVMREDGVLERAVWVAPMNEVPHFAGRQMASVRKLRQQAPDEGGTVLERNEEEDKIFRRINHWMGAPIKAEIAREQIPLSYSSLGQERYARRLTDIYDVVDVHFMPPVLTDEEDEAALAEAAQGVPKPHRFAQFEQMDLEAYSRAWDGACRKHYPAMLRRALDYHHMALANMTLPSGKRLVAINTEPFGPCFFPDSPQVSWEWYKRYNSDGLRLVAGLDFAGCALSNYAEPLFRLWEDAEWHLASNVYFLETATP